MVNHLLNHVVGSDDDVVIRGSLLDDRIHFLCGIVGILDDPDSRLILEVRNRLLVEIVPVAVDVDLAVLAASAAGAEHHSQHGHRRQHPFDFLHLRSRPFILNIVPVDHQQHHQRNQEDYGG